MVSRLLRIPAEGGLDALADFVRSRIEKNRSVLVVTASLPAGALFEHFQDHGVDTNRVFIVDAVSSRGGMDVHGDPEHVHFIPAPTLLELLAARVEKIIKAKAQGPPHIIVHSANAFAAYNDPATLEEIVRYTVNVLVHPKVRIDYVVEATPPLPPAFLKFLETFLDEDLTLPVSSPPPSS